MSTLSRDERRTTQALLEHYHSVRSRPSIDDPAQRRLLFRVYERQLGTWLPGEKTARILDAGCGEGALLAFLKARGHTTLEGFDLCQENIDECRRRDLPFVQQHDLLQVDAWPGAQPYALILLMDVLEHVPKDDACRLLTSLRRRLSAGGAIVVRTPNMGCLFASWMLYGDLSHAFGLTETSILDLFVLAGFQPQDIDVRPAWDSATFAGRIRDRYLCLLHRMVCMAAGASYPRIPTRNLLVRAVRREVSG